MLSLRLGDRDAHSYHLCFLCSVVSYWVSLSHFIQSPPGDFWLIPLGCCDDGAAVGVPVCRQKLLVGDSSDWHCWVRGQQIFN